MAARTRSAGARARISLLWLFLGVLSAVYLFPLYFDLISSVKSTTAIFSKPFLPTANPMFANFAVAFRVGKIHVAFLNSMIISAGTIVLVCATASLASFVLAKMIFRLRSTIYVLFIMGLMVPVQAVIIPLTIQVSLAGLRGNFLVIMLIFTAQFLPLAVFILVGFMRTIPTELEEAAYVDGAGHVLIFLNVILPLSSGGLSTVIIFVFLYSWNDLLVPLVFTVGESQRTLSIGLLAFFGGMSGQSSYGAFMAAVLFVIIPPIVLYLAASDTVQKGLTAGAIKG